MTDYQLAKSQIANDPRSVKPESLTRRNGTLIARYFCPRWESEKCCSRCWQMRLNPPFPKPAFTKLQWIVIIPGVSTFHYHSHQRCPVGMTDGTTSKKGSIMKLYEIREEIETALLTPEDEHFSPQRH